MDENLLSTENIEHLKEMVMDYAPKLVLAVIVLIIGFWVIGKIAKGIERMLDRSKMEISLQKFLGSLASVFLKIMLLLSIANMVGIDTMSFVTIFGALMVGIGMALNGTVSHFASGVMLMIFKPFKVGDLVVIGDGKKGVVEEINAFNTTLETLDNKRIIVGNSNVIGNTITNITGQGTVGVELTFGIGYNCSIDEARKIILKVGSECPHIINKPAQGVVVAELGDSSVNLATRPFCKPEHYWDVKFFMQENVKKQFDANNISIPFPQMDIHMQNN